MIWYVSCLKSEVFLSWDSLGPSRAHQVGVVCLHMAVSKSSSLINLLRRCDEPL